MRSIVIILVFLFSFLASGQEDLAKQYFREGDFKKSAALYEKLLERQPGRMDYADGLIASWQQLEEYEKAKKLLLQRTQSKRVFPTLLVDLGYNYSLQGQSEEANDYYQQALARIQDNPNLGYSLGYRFQNYSLLNEALQAYATAMELNPQLDYTYQMARIYGEQGDLPNMFATYLELIDRKPASSPNVLRALEGFIKEDPEYENNLTLRRLLLEKVQSTRDLLWNELLSWLFVQQRQYRQAFSQEKAIFRRGNSPNLQRLQGLAVLAKKGQQPEVAKDIYTFILKESTDPGVLLQARLKLIDLKLDTDKEPDFKNIQREYRELLEIHGFQSESLPLMVAYADFQATYLDRYDSAIELLKKGDEIPLSRYGEARLKMALADILVMDERFDEALITYTQVQNRVKNDLLGQEARFKVARTSFFKGDFDWALVQLKVLRGSSSQLIANDAMQLSLLISDNSQEDSTRTALKKYAHANLLAYQGKKSESIEALEQIIRVHKGETIEDEALLRQAQLLETEGQLERARLNYEKIIAFFPRDILMDDALYALGELYRNELGEPDKAMAQYERIIFNHEDSYFYPMARQHYRTLRGDNIN